MKGKILNGLLILTSLFGYLEWGKDNSVFLFQAEAEVISKLFTDPASAAHPFTILPLVGQLLLFITLFQKRPVNVLTYTGMAGIGVLLVFMFVIGVISLNFRIVFSTIPFLIVSFLTVKHLRRS
ncbi:MAG TPA: hypothetical protein PLV21_10670 [Cyclobacteriaceae bacterium]|nr:hypothetical protein [Cyclobacteriaceae bacterium]HRJ82340.1 hypothetical protein [Cyclobacteriaceae bacterium]